MTEHQQDKIKENIPARPQKLELKLLERKSYVGTDIVSFKFSRSEDNNNYYLNYTAGQYAVFDLGTKEDPEGPIRSFTLASSPTEENFILISTRIRDTPFKKKLDSLDVGISVKLTAPLGKFVLHEDHSRAAVFLSGGIGVTPFRSMIKYATDKQLSVKIILFDANRNHDNILYKKEFDECANLNKNLKVVYTLGVPDKDWKGELGHINQTMVTKYVSTIEMDNSIFYICGPPGMLNAMRELLQADLGIPKERIKIEEFTGY
ncbi:MAG: FAD-dependent oxidoreductase [Candidatus Nitrosopolaris sp.]